MGIALGDNINITAGLPADCRYYNGSVPYVDINEANSVVDAGVRFSGLTVNIAGTEYWYKNGIGNGDLIEKMSTAAGGGMLNWTGSTSNAIGTYISASGICAQPNLTFDGTTLNVTGIVSASTCFSGDGDGLTGTAASFTAGQATNATCLGGVIASNYLRGDVYDTKVSGALRFNDNISAIFGTGEDMCIYHNTTNSYIDNKTGLLLLRVATTENAVVATPNSCTSIYYDGTEKLKTITDGICALGRVAANDHIEILDNTNAEGFKIEWNDTEKSIDFIIN